MKHQWKYQPSILPINFNFIDSTYIRGRHAIFKWGVIINSINQYIPIYPTSEEYTNNGLHYWEVTLDVTAGVIHAEHDDEVEIFCIL